MYVIGIDPGKRGAIAIIDRESNSLVVLSDTPLQGKDYDPVQMMALLNKVQGDRRAFIEKQSGFRSDSHGASFTTGFGYGVWVTLLKLLDIPYEEVPPRKWQKRMGILNNCYGNTKKASLEMARGCFPKGLFEKKDGRSDATLIGVFGCINTPREQPSEVA